MVNDCQILAYRSNKVSMFVGEKIDQCRPGGPKKEPHIRTSCSHLNLSKK